MWYVWQPLYYTFFTECSSKKIVKIGQYLAKIWTKFCGLLFGPPCIAQRGRILWHQCTWWCHQILIGDPKSTPLSICLAKKNKQKLSIQLLTNASTCNFMITHLFGFPFFAAELCSVILFATCPNSNSFGYRYTMISIICKLPARPLFTLYIIDSSQLEYMK